MKTYFAQGAEECASSTKRSAEEVIRNLCQKIDETLEPLLPPGSRCALFNFPHHPNIGDSAIWLGQEDWLRRHRVEIAYVCDLWTYSPQRLREKLGSEGTILLSGGGDVGDVWPLSQQFRERVITEFPKHRIIQLPQSFHFNEEKNLLRAKSVFNRHPRFTLMARADYGADFARREFQVPVLLCPDMALALGPIPRPISPSAEVVWLSRSDIESKGKTTPTPHLPNVIVKDWLKEPRTKARQVDRFISSAMIEFPKRLRGLSDLRRPLFRRIAQKRLREGCRLLSQGRMVITDRLHGHIVSLLLGIPHILLDNSYGKLSRFYKTWTQDCKLTTWADSSDEAIRLARATIAKGQ